MSKLKSLSSLKKRIKRSARGKFVHRRSGTSHNNASKSKRRKRRLHSAAVAHGGLHKRVRQMVPYA